MKPLKVLRIGTVESLDPVYCNDTAEKLIFDNVCETLFIYSDTLQGCIAKKYTVDTKGLNYTLTIDIDKKFSDGTLLSVDVVVKNLLRVRDSENQIGILFKRFIKSIVAISKDKILIRLSKRCAFFLLLLTTAYTAIVSEKSLCSLKNKKIANLIGSGAYRIKKLNSDIIILTKNEYYKQELQFEKVEILISSDIEKRNTLLDNEILDISQFDTTISDKTEVSKNYYFKLSKCFDTMCFLFNLRTCNFLFRKLVLYCTDTEYFHKEARNGQAYRIQNAIPEGILGHKKNKKTYFNMKYACRINKLIHAKKHIVICSPKGLTDRKLMCENLVKRLQFLGFTTEFYELDWKSFLKKQQEGSFDIMLVSMAADYPDPHNFISEFYGEEGTFSKISLYKNRVIYSLVNMASMLCSSVIRNIIYAVIQYLTSLDTVYVWLGQTIDFRLYHKNIITEEYSPFWGEYVFSKIKAVPSFAAKT